MFIKNRFKKQISEIYKIEHEVWEKNNLFNLFLKFIKVIK